MSKNDRTRREMFKNKQPKIIIEKEPEIAIPLPSDRVEAQKIEIEPETTYQEKTAEKASNQDEEDSIIPFVNKKQIKIKIKKKNKKQKKRYAQNAIEQESFYRNEKELD
jgi:hypothetical protein